jgi:hypothetical protein
MSEQDWGFGNGSKYSPGPFAVSAMDDGTPFELLFGEHPHSRRDDNIYARFPDGRIEAFDGHRVLTRVNLRTFNYLKCSGLSGNEVRRGGQFQIFLNDKLVWAEFIRDATHGLRKAESTLAKILDSPVSIWDDKWPEIGRKLFYMNHPAVITGFDCDEHESSGNRLYLKSETGTFPRPAWSEPEDHDDDDRESIATDTLSPHIWWWRK